MNLTQLDRSPRWQGWEIERTQTEITAFQSHPPQEDGDLTENTKMDANQYVSNNVTLDLVKQSASKSLVFLSAGAEKLMPDGKRKMNFLVEIDGMQRQYTPNSTTIKALIAKYGSDTSAWMGKRITLSAGVVNGKDAIIGVPA